MQKKKMLRRTQALPLPELYQCGMQVDIVRHDDSAYNGHLHCALMMALTMREHEENEEDHKEEDCPTCSYLDCTSAECR